MKPSLFKSEAELMSFINRLPVSDRKVKVPGMFDGEFVGCPDIVLQIKVLVPRMFELRALIVKGLGGLGNYKSLERFVDTAAGNISDEQVRAYLAELEIINTEVGTLVEGGLNEDVADQLSSAKSKVAALKMIRETVMAFDAKVQGIVARLNEKYLSLCSSLAQVKKAQTTQEAKSAIGTALEEFQKTQNAVVSLGEDLHKYCLLQVAYNSSIMS